MGESFEAPPDPIMRRVTAPIGCTATPSPLQLTGTCDSIRVRIYKISQFRGNVMRSGKLSAVRSRLAWMRLLPFMFALHGAAFAQTDLTIYDEALAPGWQNWSWATNDTASTANANTGSVSIAVTAGAWSALYLRSADAALDTPATSTSRSGSTAEPPVARRSRSWPSSTTRRSPACASPPPRPARGRRSRCRSPTLGADDRTGVNGFWLQQGSGVDDPTYYVDTSCSSRACRPPLRRPSTA